MSSVNSKRGGPLQGVRVVELTKIWAGPETGKQLAYLGAEVIRIESEGAIDGTRIMGAKDFNHAPGHQAVNPQKLSAQIDIKNPKGIELILDLIRESDMVIENLRPGAMERLGLGYEVIKSVNPNVICVSMSMYGNDGPLAYQTGYAPCFAAIGGLTALVGYEGETPTGINIRYGDPTYGAAGTFAGLVALLHRRNTGKGQFVDVSAVETMTTMIADSVMEHAINGVEHQCDGNRHSEMAPHNLYRCAGDDWVSIAVASDKAWCAMADAMADPGLADDPRFRSLADRKANEKELDEVVGAWTSGRSVGEVVSQLQARGIPAGKSQSSIDMISDGLLWSRGFYPEITEFDGTMRPTVGPGAKLTRSAAIIDGAPALGKHTSYVLGEILGLSSAEQEQLAAAGITR